jgi:outer membrane protein TolC
MKIFFVVVTAQLFLYAYTIDFTQAIDKTLQNNKGLQAKKLDIEQAKLSVDEASGYNYGKLVFQENISRTNNAGHVFGMKLASREADFGAFGFDQFISQMDTIMPGASYDGGKKILATQPDNLNYPDARTNYETKVVYQAPLFTGFKLNSAKKMAQLQLLAHKAQYTFDEKNLTLEVLKAYNGAVAAKEFIKATQKAKKATNSFVEFATALYDEGLVTSIDVKQASVYDMDVETHKIEAHNRFELAIAYLRFLTSDDTISDVGDFKVVQSDDMSMAAKEDNIYQNRGDYQSMKYHTQTMKTKIDFQSAEKYPTVGIQAEYGYNDDTFGVSDIDQKDYYLGAIGISYTLFDGGVTSKRSQKAKIQYNQIINNFEYMKEGIKLEVQNNLLTLQAKQKVLKQKIKAKKLSDEVLEQSTAMYKNHLINMSNLLLQQANQQKAEAEVIMAKYESSLAAAQLKISLGENL